MAYTNSPPDFRPPNVSTPSRPLWKDPLFWGAAISLSAHGVLWLISPLLPGSDRRTEADVQRPVELVELSPIDQNRLPDALTQPPVLPDVAEPDFADPDFSSGSLEGEPPISFAPIFPTLPPPPPPATSFRPRPWTPFPSRRSPSSPTPSPTPTETPDPPAETTDDGPNANDLNDGEVITGNSNTTEGSSDTEPTVEGATPQFPPDLVAFVQENPEQFAFNEDGTGAEAANTNWGDWLVDQAYPWLAEDGLSDAELEEKADATLTPGEMENVPYPPIACVASAQLSGKAATELTAEDLVSGSVVVGVLVGPDGRVEEDSDPFLLRSSGFAFLDAEALEIAKAYEPQPTSWREIYSVQINFAPNPATCEQLLQEGAAPSEDA
ncbi:MAG: energy transducer TonB [Cyanobacteria bacterium J06638_20]